MTATEFKTGIKELKGSLKNLTLQLINSHSVRPYSTLREFGNAILNEEKNGNSFCINQAFTNSGVVKVNSINQLAQLLVNGTVTVTGIQFEAYHDYSSNSFAECLKYNFGTTE